ncbi:hypothetical protein VNO78_10163 [Psophocarpus tetragonolobus]|uniref:Initiator tRNA phosphoribosyl transferase family protein n=1 Tax=Psophocarpus tetragonolobus TaxID=3891 RepID=A0AAN9SKB6_PSOTE
MEESGRDSIYKAARKIKKRENSLYNALRSIYEDSIFVSEISELWPEVPLVGNLRCGLWYSRSLHSTCYFKSTDGHSNNWSFSTARLNIHVALLAAGRGGCMIVDSTRRGKRFPDSMSKTIPIWACVLNRAVRDLIDISPWDCSLHLPLWVSQTERASIETRLDEWTLLLKQSGADIASLAASLRKPLRPLWISHRTVIWLNHVPHHESWDFTPVILLSASASSSDCAPHHTTTSQFSWSYIPGAGDDEETWAKGLSPSLFWKHAYDLINSPPHLCNRMVADIVESTRLTVQPLLSHHLPLASQTQTFSISFLASTNLALSPSHLAADAAHVDCILNCDQRSISARLPSDDLYLHLPMVTSKFNRFSLLNNLPKAVSFAKFNLSQGKRLLVCCNNGEDISVCVCLAILMSLFDEKGTFDDGKSFNATEVTKWDMKRRLVYVCKFATDARPSRGNLRQVFNFLIGGKRVHHPDTEGDE